MSVNGILLLVLSWMPDCEIVKKQSVFLDWYGFVKVSLTIRAAI
jgi:hypothetical protein